MAGRAIPRPRWLRYAALAPAVAAAAVARLPGPLAPHAVVLVTAVLILAGALAAQAIGAGQGQPPLRRLMAVDAGVAASMLITLPPPLRAHLLATPMAVASFALAIGLHLAWAAVRAFRLSPALPRDFRGRAEAILAEFVPPRIAGPAAAELDVLRYAIGWRMKPDVPPGAQAFTYHRSLTPIFWTLVFVSGVEIGLTHLVVALIAPKAAWLVAGLSEFGLVYLLGAGNAFARRPILLTDTHLHIRTGLIVEARLPLDRIAAVRQVLDAGDRRRPGFLKASLLAYPNVLVELTEPTAVAVAFRPARLVTTIGLHPDDAAAFMAAVAGASARG
jgi:hypothetical protein